MNEKIEKFAAVVLPHQRMMPSYAGIPIDDGSSNIGGDEEDVGLIGPAGNVGVLGGLTGAAGADRRDNVAVDRLRGLLKGVGAATGGYYGNRLTMPEDGELDWNAVGGTLGGAGLGYAGTAGLLHLMGVDKAKKKGVLDRDNEEEKEAEASPALVSLLTAKMHSDQKQYLRKHAILRGLIQQAPSDFMIDSDDGRILGLTHTPTSFRIHMPTHMMPQGVELTRQPSTEKAAAYLLGLLNRTTSKNEVAR